MSKQCVTRSQAVLEQEESPETESQDRKGLEKKGRAVQWMQSSLRPVKEKHSKHQSPPKPCLFENTTTICAWQKSFKMTVCGTGGITRWIVTAHPSHIQFTVLGPSPRTCVDTQAEHLRCSDTYKPPVPFFYN